MFFVNEIFSGVEIFGEAATTSSKKPSSSSRSAATVGTPRLSRKNRWSSSTGDTVEAWLHTTSSVSISRLGTLSAQASDESFTLRFVWWATVRTASGRTRIRPV